MKNKNSLRKIIFAVFVLIFVVFSGCVSTHVALYNKDISYPATEPSTIEIFQKKPETRKFTDIGEVTVEGAADWNDVYRVFKIKAAEYGGNAVYVYRVTEQKRTYVEPHGCHFYNHFYYRHGYYFPEYYYCYGYEGIESATFLTVVGIIIKYNTR